MTLPLFLKRLLLSLLFIGCIFVAYSQRNLKSLDLNVYARWDYYPSFDYANNSVSTNTVTIKGTSWGIGTNYLFKVKKNLYGKLGLGYYRHSFNNIQNNNSSFGLSDARIINYPGTVDVIYRTNRYWYNTLSLSIGLQQWFFFKNNLQVFVGADLTDYLTFSQYYRITHDPPTGPPDHKFMQYRSGSFGFSAQLQTGLTKTINRLSLGPFLSIPVYDQWHTDHFFPTERDADYRSKLFNGVAVGLRCMFLLSGK